MLLPGIEDEDRALANQVAGYWARFARTGDPNGPAAPHWTRYSLKDEKYLILDNPIDIGQGFKDKECDSIEELAGM
jgi:carboxylesterase type B